MCWASETVWNSVQRYLEAHGAWIERQIWHQSTRLTTTQTQRCLIERIIFLKLDWTSYSEFYSTLVVFGTELIIKRLGFWSSGLQTSWCTVPDLSVRLTFGKSTVYWLDPLYVLRDLTINDPGWFTMNHHPNCTLVSIQGRRDPSLEGSVGLVTNRC